MDAKALKKLEAAATHERFVADRAAEAVERAQMKVRRAQAGVTDAEEMLAEAQCQAVESDERATTAEAAWRGAADGVSVKVAAQTAVASAENLGA